MSGRMVDYSLWGCLKAAWSQSDGNLPSNKSLIIRLILTPLFLLPMIQWLKFSPLSYGEARAVLLGVVLLATSLDLVHSSYLLKIGPGIENKDQLDAGFKTASIVGYFLGLVLLSSTLMIWGGP